MCRSYDWIKIRSEYIYNNISQRKLAEKHNIPWTTLRDRANREGWATLRDEHLKSTEQKIRQKTQKKIIDKVVTRNEKHLKILDKALDVVDEYLSNGKEKSFVLKTKSVDEDGSFIEGVAEVELNAVNTKAFSEMIKSLEVIQKGHRLGEGLDKAGAQEAEEPKIQIVEGVKEEEI